MAESARVLIGICGAPSVGKTTLARKLTLRLANEGAPAELLPELARILAERGVAIDQAMGDSDYDAFLEGYRERDCTASGLAIADRTPVDHYSYLAANSNASPALLERHHSAVLDDVRRYRLLLYLPIEFPLRDDGFRITDPAYQRQLDAAIRTLLEESDVPCVRLSGHRGARLRAAEAAVKEACPEWFSTY